MGAQVVLWLDRQISTPFLFKVISHLGTGDELGVPRFLWLFQLYNVSAIKENTNMSCSHRWYVLIGSIYLVWVFNPPCLAQSHSVQPRQNTQERITVQKPLLAHTVTPVDKTTLCAGNTYLIETVCRLDTTDLDGLELLITIYVNGVKRPPAKLTVTSEVSAKSKWTWPICAAGDFVNVDIVITGKRSGERIHQTLARVRRTYSVAYPRSPIRRLLTKLLTHRHCCCRFNHSLVPRKTFQLP